MALSTRFITKRLFHFLCPHIHCFILCQLFKYLCAFRSSNFISLTEKRCSWQWLWANNTQDVRAALCAVLPCPSNLDYVFVNLFDHGDHEYYKLTSVSRSWHDLSVSGVIFVTALLLSSILTCRTLSFLQAVFLARWRWSCTTETTDAKRTKKLPILCILRLAGNPVKFLIIKGIWNNNTLVTHLQSWFSLKPWAFRSILSYIPTLQCIPMSV